MNNRPHSANDFRHSFLQFIANGGFIGPKKASHLMNLLLEESSAFQCWRKAKVPSATKAIWPKFVRLMRRLTSSADLRLPVQVNAVRRFYKPLLEEIHDNTELRLRDLEQLEQVASRFPTRQEGIALASRRSSKQRFRVNAEGQRRCAKRLSSCL
ncbi:MAG: hypothetical protein QGG71_26980 [Pirellulaceae bacterium]|nr:hypothetical protein [Pirellulaceae bacterium]